MSGIIVKETNRDRIEAEIEKAQKRCSARCVDYEMVTYAISKIEDRLAIAKKSMLGVVFDVDVFAQNFPNAYKYTPESTHFRLSRTASGWKVDNIRRARTRTHGHKYVCCEMPDECQRAVIEAAKDF